MTDPVTSKHLINELRLRARHEIRIEGIDPVSVLTRAADEIERLSRRCTDVEGFIRMMGWKFDGEFYEAITPEPQADVESQEFYELMQTYRHTPVVDQAAVVAAFEAVKAFVIGPAQPPRADE